MLTSPPFVECHVVYDKLEIYLHGRWSEAAEEYVMSALNNQVLRQRLVGRPVTSETADAASRWAANLVIGMFHLGQLMQFNGEWVLS